MPSNRGDAATSAVVTIAATRVPAADSLRTATLAWRGVPTTLSTTV
jgi:hypothetical protein